MMVRLLGGDEIRLRRLARLPWDVGAGLAWRRFHGFLPRRLRALEPSLERFELFRLRGRSTRTAEELNRPDLLVGRRDLEHEADIPELALRRRVETDGYGAAGPLELERDEEGAFRPRLPLFVACSAPDPFTEDHSRVSVLAVAVVVPEGALRGFRVVADEGMHKRLPLSLRRKPRLDLAKFGLLANFAIIAYYEESVK